MDEKVKHRLVGLAVVIAMTAIFAPVLVKQSNQKWNETVSTNFDVPAPPEKPDVMVSTEQEIFRSNKVAQVSLDEQSGATRKLSKIARTQLVETKQPQKTQLGANTKSAVDAGVASSLISSLEKDRSSAKTVDTRPASHTIVKHETIKKVATMQIPPVSTLSSAKIDTAKKINTVKSKRYYAIQLASFSREANAKKVVTRLRTLGYQAHWVTKKNSKGILMTKVIVGRNDSLKKAHDLLAKLEKNTKLKGIVVQA